MESVAARKPNDKTSSFAFPKVLSKVLKLDFWCFRMPYGAAGAPKISKLQLVGVITASTLLRHDEPHSSTLVAYGQCCSLSYTSNAGLCRKMFGSDSENAYGSYAPPRVGVRKS